MDTSEAPDGEYVVLDDGTRFIVEAVRKNRVMRVHIYLPEPENEAEAAFGQ